MSPPPPSIPHRFALDRLGFRPFFLLASVFAAASVGVWFGLYHFHLRLPAGTLSSTVWHAHAMIYGYAPAVIAGFLLTAVRNWTGVPTLHGPPLLLLALVWLCARLAPFVPHPLAIPAMALFDLSFGALLCTALLLPLIAARQWKQLGLWFKLVFLLLGNLLFYLGLFGLVPDGVRLGLYTGLYLIVSLILVMSRRVLPFFIERGVGYAVTLTNRGWLDVTSLVLMLVFLVAEVFAAWPAGAAVTAGLLCVLHGVRLAGWYTPGIWRKPLLWSLYLAYGWLALGFGMTVAAHLLGVAPALAIHAFAYGGIGLMTLAMMARVTLGHTGRDISPPPRPLTGAFALLVTGSVLRVLAPLIAPGAYPTWIALAQILWIGAFALFVWIYAPMLVLPRVDGRDG